MWEHLAAPLVTALPYVSAVTLLDDVPGAARASWEENMTAEYGRPVHILEFVVSDTVMPPAEQYYVVAAVVGHTAGVLVPGRNPFSNPPRAGAIAAALAANDVAVSRGVCAPCVCAMICVCVFVCLCACVRVQQLV